ncbi:hypothetical protein N7478_004302 [Penicillium angulare]|uniref:uncharacterized protein n=1 Tax=Penicillium angulare TaxID=116970 RepID=UPI00253F8BC6|nr:uncharacterized protein N7478_004302 [Penicillium angulare]KAJ5278930.1 hypothetical protein N7478_004302 [Penicillium angulare]
MSQSQVEGETPTFIEGIGVSGTQFFEVGVGVGVGIGKTAHECLVCFIADPALVPRAAALAEASKPVPATDVFRYVL